MKYARIAFIVLLATSALCRPALADSIIYPDMEEIYMDSFSGSGGSFCFFGVCW